MQQLCTFSQKLSNKNKQQLYKIQKRPTSLFYHVLLIKQNEYFKKVRYLVVILTDYIQNRHLNLHMEGVCPPLIQTSNEGSAILSKSELRTTKPDISRKKFHSST